MAFTHAQIRASAKQTYEHVNATFYNGRLPSWGSFEFRVTDSRRRLGCIRHMRSPYTNTHTIVRFEVSDRLADVAALADTVYHEIAHVASLVIDGHSGHGYSWMKHCNLVGGARPVRCSTDKEVETRSGDWILSCEHPDCGKTWTFQKRSKNVQRALAT